MRAVAHEIVTKQEGVPVAKRSSTVCESRLRTGSHVSVCCLSGSGGKTQQADGRPTTSLRLFGWLRRLRRSGHSNGRRSAATPSALSHFGRGTHSFRSKSAIQLAVRALEALENPFWGRAVSHNRWRTGRFPHATDPPLRSAVGVDRTRRRWHPGSWLVRSRNAAARQRQAGVLG